jgi:uncharacterized protein with beta-barrel porin domain
MQRSVTECIVSRAPRPWCGRVGGAIRASLALITALAWSVAPASAQQCTPTGTNQTCTNSIFLTGGIIGLFDNGTAKGLTVTNTNNGTISGTNGGGNGIGIRANTATVTNNGTITGTGTGPGTGGIGILAVIGANSTATVTNNGTISGTGTGAGSGGRGIVATTATVTNNGTISGTGTGFGSGINATTATVTNNGTISGSSDGIEVGTATVTNNGTISGTGTSVGGFGAGISALTGTVTNNGTITGTTFAIQLFGAGGDNTLTLGPTSIINGTVSAAGSNNALQLGGSGVGSFDVSLIGPAAQYRGFDTFNKIGAASWTLTGFNAGALPWTVQQGILLVNGSLANSPFTVNGGTLGGTGTIGTTQVNSGGTLAPGLGAPGASLTINGNLAFQSAALYLVQVNSSTASLANVTGTASLAGTVQANIASATHKSYDILHSAGLGGSRFNALVLTNPNFSGSLSYTATDVFLSLTANLGAGSNLNQNQQNVANALNNVFNSGGTLPLAFAGLFGLTGGNLANALSQLDGEVATGAERAAFQLTNEFLNLMLDPFVNGRANVGGVGGGAIGFAPEEQASLPEDVALAYAPILNKAPALKPFEQPWTAWGSGFGGSNRTNGDPSVGSSNVTASIFGFAGGMDYHVSPSTVVGFALAGAGTNWGLANALGTGRSDAFQVGGYGISWFGPAYVAGALAFTNHWFTTGRTALGDQLNANFLGQSYGARLESGYHYAVLPIFGVTPYGAVQFQDFQTPAYSESDATGGGFGLSHNAQNATDVRTELGSRFDAPTLLYGRPLVLYGRAAWAHDFVNNPSLSAVFQALPGGSFTVNGAPIPHDSALTTAGAQLFLTPRWTLLAKFDGEFANGSQTYAGSGTLRYTW